jgi:hypothetical protein
MRQCRRYGGRGITVSPLWVNDFQRFYEDVGPAPTPQHSIDRIDNDGNYEPGNVRWATATQQVHNRRNTVKIEYRGSLFTVPELVARYACAGITASRFVSRFYKGWPVERALTLPVRPRP